MKFRLSTLFWCLTLVAVVLGSYQFVIQQRVASQNKVAEAQAMAAETTKWAMNVIATSNYYKRGLGIFDDIQDETKPTLLYVRLPDELGGKQHHGLPFIWQWRIYLPGPNDFELCWATQSIPQDDSFDLPEDSIHRSHLNLVDGHSVSGISHGTDSLEFDGESPLEVVMYVRVDATEQGGTLFVNYEITKPKALRINNSTVSRGERHQLSADDVSWLLGSL
jgi:hypothetical protein